MKSQNRTIASSVLHVLKQSLRPLLVGAALLGAQFVTATPTLAQDSTVTKAKNASGYFGATVKLSATLQRSKDKAYLSGLSLTFKIDVTIPEYAEASAISSARSKPRSLPRADESKLPPIYIRLGYILPPQSPRLAKRLSGLLVVIVS